MPYGVEGVPEGSETVFARRGEILQTVSGGGDPIVLRTYDTLDDPTESYRVWVQAIPVDQGRLIAFTRCKAGAVPVGGGSPSSPTWDWEFGILDPHRDVETVFFENAFDIFLARRSSSSSWPYIAIANDGSDENEGWYRYFTLVGGVEGSLHLHRMAEDSPLLQYDSAFPEALHGTMAWLGPADRWYFFESYEPGICSFWYLGGVEIASGRRAIFQILSTTLYAD